MVVEILGIATAVLTLVGGIMAGVLWVRNTMAAQLRQERETSDRLYANKADVAAMNERLNAMASTLEDVRDTLHELARSLRESRK